MVYPILHFISFQRPPASTDIVRSSGMISNNQGTQNSRLYIAFLVLGFLGASFLILESSHLIQIKSTVGSNSRKRRKSSHIHIDRRLSIEQENIQRTIFYNVYVPNEEKKSRVMSIVKEQLNELKSSTIWDNSIELFFNVIGYNASEDIQQECGNQCHLLKYLPKGDEGVTLLALYDYCQDRSEDDTTVVTYIHDKGSLHSNPKNRHLRMLLTKGVFSKECQSIGMKGSTNTCNVCGSRFSPFPHHHMAGNMWTATCSYIKKLHRPDTFPDKMEQLMVSVLQTSNINSHNTTIPKPTLQQYEDEYFVGRGRFAYEHWIGSHPSMKPCDVYPGEYLCGYIDVPSPTQDLWIPDLQPSPRFPLSVFQKRSPKDGTWSCGQGRLLEYQSLYGQTPPKDSFIWTFYSTPFKTCTESLDYDKHQSLFSEFTTIG